MNNYPFLTFFFNPIDEQLDIIKEQSRLLEMSMDTDYFVGGGGDCEDDDENIHRLEAEQEFEQTTLEIKAQWDAVNNRNQALNEERRKFTESAVRLGVERLNFEVKSHQAFF
jgi:hypothetical protein